VKRLLTALLLFCTATLLAQTRPAADLILVRHDQVLGLGMGAMELMAVFAEPPQLDAVVLSPGDQVRLSVRQIDDRLILLRIEKGP